MTMSCTRYDGPARGTCGPRDGFARAGLTQGEALAASQPSLPLHRRDPGRAGQPSATAQLPLRIEATALTALVLLGYVMAALHLFG